MPLESTYYNLQNVRLEVDEDVYVDITQLDIEYMLEYAERRPGSSKVKDKVIIGRDAKISAKGWQGSSENLAKFVLGQRLTALTVKSTETGTPSMLPADFFTYFPVTKMCIGKAKTSFALKPSEWDIEIDHSVTNTTPAA